MTLNCNFKYLKDLDDNTKEIYACEAMNFSNRLQHMPINYVTNLHDLDKRDRDVKVFIIKNQVCTFLPTKIDNFFPFLQEIEVGWSGLRQLSRENFVSLPKLTMAIFPGNDLEYLPGDLFSNNPRLTHIDFSQNKIKIIDKNFFHNLHHLKYVMFDSNECYDDVGIPLHEIDMIKDEILQNCSKVIKPERPRVVKVEETKIVEKPKEVPKKEDKKEEPKASHRPEPTIKVLEAKQVRSSAGRVVPLQLAAMYFSLQAFATLFYL